MHIPGPLRTFLSSALLAVLLPGVALAHPGHGEGSHLVEGVLHPLSGLDHLLMLTAISAWAAQLQPTGRVLVSLCLALFVGIGASLHAAGGPLLEMAIALTVIGAGVLLAVGRHWPLWASGLLAAAFASIHGLAHGAEGPPNSTAYVAGLLLATGGYALTISFIAARLQSHRAWWRAAGVLSAATGGAALVAG